MLSDDFIIDDIDANELRIDLKCLNKSLKVSGVAAVNGHFSGVQEIEQR